MIQRNLRLRVILPVVGVAAVAAAALYAGFGLAGLTAALAGGQLATLLLVLLLARGRRVEDRRARAEARRRHEQLTQALARIEKQTEKNASALDKNTRRIDKNGEKTASNVKSLRSEISALREHADARADRSDKAVAAEVADVSEQLKRQDATVQKRLREGLAKQYSQFDALTGLYYDVAPRQAFPAAGGWAASADLLRFLYDQVAVEGRNRILECGSGVSTVLMGYALQRRGEGKVVALEHLEQFAEQTRQLAAAHGLDDFVEVRHAPLTTMTVEGEEWPWYDVSEVPAGPFDLLVVDGPPAGVRDHARFPAVPVLHDRLADSALVVLDDHNRPEEKAVGERWQQAFPDFTAQRLKHEKGTLTLRRDPESA